MNTLNYFKKWAALAALVSMFGIATSSAQETPPHHKAVKKAEKTVKDNTTLTKETAKQSARKESTAAKTEANKAVKSAEKAKSDATKTKELTKQSAKKESTAAKTEANKAVKSAEKAKSDAAKTKELTKQTVKKENEISKVEADKALKASDKGKSNTSVSTVKMKNSASAAKKSATDKLSSEKYNGHAVYIGPEGGKYYINSNGNKTYIPRN